MTVARRFIAGVRDPMACVPEGLRDSSPGFQPGFNPLLYRQFVGGKRSQAQRRSQRVLKSSCRRASSESRRRKVARASSLYRASTTVGSRCGSRTMAPDRLETKGEAGWWLDTGWKPMLLCSPDWRARPGGPGLSTGSATRGSMAVILTRILLESLSQFLESEFSGSLL
jgi:hypothetical protein